ncbi:MAG: glutathione peroxidase [Verrucomicrobia bacterium]|nr:glutathione peroxidase [Verrucomicrobiota bacterium]
MRLFALLLIMTSLSAAPDLLRIPVKDIDGKETTLGAGKPKAVLVVNVASACGYTRQYAGLQDLHEAFKDKGLVVAGFPCNDFGGQEPGDEREIRRFCSTRFKVTFPMFSKVRIKGDAHPLFEALTSKESGQPGPVSWNFGKFLIGSDGRLIARYDSGVEPDDAKLRADIEKALK